MKTKSKAPPQAVRLDDAAKKEIEALARKLGVSKSSLIRIAVNKGLPKVKEAFA